MVRTAALIFALVASASALAQVHIPTTEETMQNIQAERDAWDKEHMPAGFPKEVWENMTRNEQIHVQVAIEDNPRPLAKDSQAAVLDAVKAQLKDPDSAKFRDVKRRGPLDYCGWVNAKNSFGGYGGYAVFFANAKWTLLVDPEASEPKFCP